MAEELIEKKQTLAERFRGFYPVVIDVETAGFNPQTDALLEFAAITLKFDDDGNLVKNKSYHYNVAPFHGANIVQANIDFIGINPFDPERHALPEKTCFIPFFKAISKEVKDAGCKRAILVGHNGNFDYSFLKAVTERLGYKRSPFHPFSVIDTASLCALMLGQTVLSISCRTLGIEFNDKEAHGAMYDTDRECELFCQLVNRLKAIGGWPLDPQMQAAAIEANETVNYSRSKAESEDSPKASESNA